MSVGPCIALHCSHLAEREKACMSVVVFLQDMGRILLSWSSSFFSASSAVALSSDTIPAIAFLLARVRSRMRMRLRLNSN